jgi:hypothetical protein
MKKPSAIHVRGYVAKVIVGVLTLSGIGYISSAITQQRCENAAALALMTDQMQSQPFYIIVGDDVSQAIFSRLGAKYTLYTLAISPNPQNGARNVKRYTWPNYQPMPHVDQGGRTASVSSAKLSLPFIVSVDHTAVYGSLGADGSTSYYLCLLGLPIKIREEVNWVS